MYFPGRIEWPLNPGRGQKYIDTTPYSSITPNAAAQGSARGTQSSRREGVSKKCVKTSTSHPIFRVVFRAPYKTHASQQRRGAHREQQGKSVRSVEEPFIQQSLDVDNELDLIVGRGGMANSPQRPRGPK
jgi:hypothetical protein